MFFRLGFIGVMFFKYLNGFDRRHLVLSSLWFHSEFLQFTSLGVSLICGDLFDRELINFGLKINPFGIWVHWFLKKNPCIENLFPCPTIFRIATLRSNPKTESFSGLFTVSYFDKKSISNVYSINKQRILEKNIFLI